MFDLTVLSMLCNSIVSMVAGSLGARPIYVRSAAIVDWIESRWHNPPKGS